MVDKSKMVTISKGNKKMGFIPSVSMTPVIACPNCATCAKKCYARRDIARKKTVRDAYAKNYNLAMNARDSYFDQITTFCKLTSFFRWHVAGDILDTDYFARMIKTARECKNTTFLAFTKNYDVVNSYLMNHRKPRNLRVVFSLPFDGSSIENPHNLPTATVIFKNQDPDKNIKICGGCCAECACRGVGCWELKKGETIGFYEH